LLHTKASSPQVSHQRDHCYERCEWDDDDYHHEKEFPSSIPLLTFLLSVVHDIVFPIVRALLPWDLQLNYRDHHQHHELLYSHGGGIERKSRVSKRQVICG